jgi:DNA primase catalytic subunit
MRIREILAEELGKHCKQKFPREFAHKFENGRFIRNERINDRFELKNLLEWYDFTDCYCSVYAFKNWHDISEERKKTAIIDTMVFDLDSENLRQSFKEAQKLVSYLLSKKTIPRVYFSGKKGFHVYIDFPEVELENFESLKRLATKISEKLNLKTVDLAVFEPARVMRTPFSRHGETNLFCKPINPEKFVEMDYLTMKSFVRHSFSLIEVHECKSFVKLLKYEDFKISTNKALRSILRRGYRIKGNGSGWKEKRIQRYTEALRKYGRLTADPEISKIHSGNEHFARLHFHCLLIEAGYSDSEIHKLFELFEDYDEKKTEYFLKYNRKWLERKKEVEA